MPHKETFRLPAFGFDAKEVQFLSSEDKEKELFNPKNLSDEEFDEMIDKIKDGKLRELKFRARIFGDKPNKKGVRPRPGQLSKIAGTLVGTQYNTDHKKETQYKGGSVDYAFAQDGELFADVSLRNPEHQERMVRGLTEAFSLEMKGKKATCSVCDTEVKHMSKFGLAMGCTHQPGMEYDGQQCEVFLDDVVGIGLAEVTVPAYEDAALFSTVTFGSNLGNYLEEAIDKDSRPREEVIQLIANQAKLKPQSVNEIMSGREKCPPVGRLAAISRILGLEIADVIKVAQSDGCSYGTRGDNMPTKEAENSAPENAGAEPEAELEAPSTQDQEVDFKAKYFDALFSAAVEKGQVEKADRPVLEVYFSTNGAVEFEEYLAGKTPKAPQKQTKVELSTEQLGETGGAPASNRGNQKEDDLAGVKLLVEMGMLSKEYADEDFARKKLAEIGADNLNFEPEG